MNVTRLRVEDQTPKEPVVVPVTRADVGVEEWRLRAVQAGERLSMAETQLKDLRAAADEARERLTKAKTRLDSANGRINELQVQLIDVTRERDELRERIARQEIVKRKVHEFRQSILDGPIWELFAEL